MVVNIHSVDLKAQIISRKWLSHINSKLSEFQKKEYYANMDIELKNILLAINIADDYFKVDRDVKSVMKDNERKDKMVLEMKHKILEQETAEAELKEQMEELRKTLETSEKKVVELNVIDQENVSKANESRKKGIRKRSRKNFNEDEARGGERRNGAAEKRFGRSCEERETSLQEKYDKQEEKLADLREKSAKKIWQMQKQNIRRMARNRTKNLRQQKPIL